MVDHHQETSTRAQHARNFADASFGRCAVMDHAPAPYIVKGLIPERQSFSVLLQDLSIELLERKALAR